MSSVAELVVVIVESFVLAEVTSDDDDNNKVDKSAGIDVVLLVRIDVALSAVV